MNKFNSTMNKKSNKEPLKDEDLELHSYRSNLPSNRASTSNLN